MKVSRELVVSVNGYPYTGNGGCLYLEAAVTPRNRWNELKGTLKEGVTTLPLSSNSEGQERSLSGKANVRQSSLSA
jgi:hypothetical protein